MSLIIIIIIIIIIIKYKLKMGKSFKNNKILHYYS